MALPPEELKGDAQPLGKRALHRRAATTLVLVALNALLLGLELCNQALEAIVHFAQREGIV